MGNSQSEQCAIIEPRQGGNGPFDLLLAFEAARLGGALFCNARIVTRNPAAPRGSVRSSE
jgi:hypothetical protein